MVRAVTVVRRLGRPSVKMLGLFSYEFTID